MFGKTSPLKKEAEAVNREATSFAKANHIDKEQQKLAERLAKETIKKALGENGGHDEDSVKLMEAQLKNAYLHNLANPNSPAAKALNNPALQDSITSSMAANVQRRQMNNGILDFSERDLPSLKQNNAYYIGQAGGDAAFQAGKSNVDAIVAHFPEEGLQEIGLSQNALRRGLTERSWMAGKRDGVENAGAKLRGERELESFEQGVDSFSEADREIKLADHAQNEALLNVQEATLNYAQSFDPQTGRFDETLGKKLDEARSKLETEKAAYQEAQAAYIEHRRDFYTPRIEAALQEKFGDQYTPAQIKAAAVALYESVIRDQDPVVQSWPTNEHDAAARIDKMVKNASDGLAAGNKYKTPDGTSLTNGQNPEADQVADLVYAARGAQPRNEVGSVVFDIMGRSEGTTNQKIIEAVAGPELQVENHAAGQQRVEAPPLVVNQPQMAADQAIEAPTKKRSVREMLTAAKESAQKKLGLTTDQKIASQAGKQAEKREARAKQLGKELEEKKKAFNVHPKKNATAKDYDPTMGGSEQIQIAEAIKLKGEIEKLEKLIDKNNEKATALKVKATKFQGKADYKASFQQGPQKNHVGSSKLSHN